MKNLMQYIQEHNAAIEQYCEMIDDINYEMICESFQCTIFKEISKQFEYLKDKYFDKLTRDKYTYGNRPTNLKTIFQNNPVLWDKINDSMIKHFSGGDPEGIKLYKRICSNRTNSIDGMIIFEKTQSNETDKNIKYTSLIIKTCASIEFISLVDTSLSSTIKPSDALSIINENVTYHIIEFTNDLLRYDIHAKRSKAKYGVINPGDPEQYQRLAQENRERYKKLAAKLKVEREANDPIPQKVSSIVNKVMELSTKFSKNIIKYHTLSYSMKDLIDMISDKRTSYYVRGKASYYGINGILYYFSSYINVKADIASGSSYQHQREEYNKAKTEIENLISKILTKIDNLESKMREIDEHTPA